MNRLPPKSDEWTTPQDLFDTLDAEFGFDVDLAATRENAKCERFLTKEDDALACEWHTLGRVGWMNPPYSRALLGRFIAKAAAEARHGFTTVALLPAKTDTIAFHKYVWRGTAPREGVEIRFVKGRLYFGCGDGRAPFPSMVVVFRGRKR